MEGRITGKSAKGWPRIQMLDDVLDGKKDNVGLKRAAEERELWRCKKN